MRFLHQHGRELFGDRLESYMQEAQFIDVTNTAIWWFDEREEDADEYGKDAPLILSPWPLAWFEYQVPWTIRLGEKGLVPWPLGGALVGVAIQQYDVPLEEAPRVLRDDEMMDFMENVIGKRPGAKQPGFDEVRREIIDKAIRSGVVMGWVSVLTLNVAHRGRRIQVVGGKYIDVDGQNIHNTGFFSIPPELVEPWGGPAVCMRIARALLGPVWFAISLLHCKNVTLVDTPILPAKVLKKRAKKGIPDVRYKTLVVEPLRQQVRRDAVNDSKGEQNHIKRAMHIARGHFKDFRDGPGLFGKYHGLYWWDMHVRGSAEAGEVVKDYKVKVGEAV